MVINLIKKITKKVPISKPLVEVLQGCQGLPFLGDELAVQVHQQGGAGVLEDGVSTLH
jgi:hypothetical protein